MIVDAMNIELVRWWESLKATPRARALLSLTRFGRKVSSQTDEDGIIQEIFRRIGVRDRRFIEFGVSNAVECNTALLLMTGWRGLWLDSSEALLDEARANHAYAGDRLDIIPAFITLENIDGLLADWCLSGEAGSSSIDLLSIDIDRNDYWVWQAVQSIRPRVVVIEYNASYPPPVEFIVPYEAEKSWENNSYFGASLTSFEALGRTKGYSLVGCCVAGVNAFFVADEELFDAAGTARFEAPFTALHHYEPARYELCTVRSGHAVAFGANAALDQAALPDPPSSRDR